MIGGWSSGNFEQDRRGDRPKPENRRPRTQSHLDRHNDWHPDYPQTRQIIREISSTFWFIREIPPYGKDCQVISPASVRRKIIDELSLLAQNYD